MTTRKDLVALKVERALLQQQVELVDTQQARLSAILEKKRLRRQRYNRRGAVQRAGRLPMEKLPALTPPPPLPVAPEHKKSIAAQKPRPLLTHATIQRFRQEHVLRTRGREELERQTMKSPGNARKPRNTRGQRCLPPSKAPPSHFPDRYARNELPCSIEHGASGLFLSWVCPPEKLDYGYYLPMFMDGLKVTEYPLSFLARQGIEDMLYAARGQTDRVISLVPKIVGPLRDAMVTYNKEVLGNVLHILRALVACNDGVGEALVPFYKLFLAPMNLFLNDTKNLGDGMDYGQRNHDDIGVEVLQTLEILEAAGGSSAFVQIKRAIPTYESIKR